MTRIGMNVSTESEIIQLKKSSWIAVVVYSAREEVPPTIESKLETKTTAQTMALDKSRAQDRNVTVSQALSIIPRRQAEYFS